MWLILKHLSSAFYDGDLLFSLVWNTWMDLEGKRLLSENNVRVGEGREKTMRGSSLPGISPDTLKTDSALCSRAWTHCTQFAGGLRCDLNTHVSSHAGRHTQYSQFSNLQYDKEIEHHRDLIPCSVARHFGVLLFLFRLICNGGVLILFFVFPLNLITVWGVCGYTSWQTCGQRAKHKNTSKQTYMSVHTWRSFG